VVVTNEDWRKCSLSQGKKIKKTRWKYLLIFIRRKKGEIVSISFGRPAGGAGRISITPHLHDSINDLTRSPKLSPDVVDQASFSSDHREEQTPGNNKPSSSPNWSSPLSLFSPISNHPKTPQLASIKRREEVTRRRGSETESGRNVDDEQ